jgi:alpha-beta hydrolase superfamily lysophospholipase
MKSGESPPLSEPLYFGATDRPLAGWLHRASHAHPTNVGVVVCNPFGYEAICTYRSLRHLADGMAAAGLPTLRFDYVGTGDSADLADDESSPNELDAWVESTRAACRTLRQLTGVERVILVGVRLGVMVAALTASDADAGIAGLVAIAPVVSGRAYLRELGMLQNSLGLDAPPANALPIAEGAQEVVGFVITPATRSAIHALSLERLPLPKTLDVLILDREDLPTASVWAELLARTHSVTRRAVEGYVEMTLDPHKAIVPREILRATIHWAVARSAPPSGPPVTEPSPRRTTWIDGVREEPVFVDDARTIFGVLTSPAHNEPSAAGRGVILLNAGTVHHVGPNRLYVRLARTWAKAGHHVLRLDLRGIGESRLPPESENFAYRCVAVEEVGAAVEFLRKEKDVQDVRVVGLCSGAYYALRSALHHDQIAGYVAINPLTFQEPPEGTRDFSFVKDAVTVERYSSSMLEGRKWKRVLTGQVRVKLVAKQVMRHSLDRARTRAGRILDRWRGPRALVDDLDVNIAELARRGVDQCFVFTKGDPGERLLAEQAGSALPTLEREGVLAVEVIDGPDHTFTPVWSHEPLVATLSKAIARSAKPNGAP